jgi:hypothetical protein
MIESIKAGAYEYFGIEGFDEFKAAVAGLGVIILVLSVIALHEPDYDAEFDRMRIEINELRVKTDNVMSAAVTPPVSEEAAVEALSGKRD